MAGERIEVAAKRLHVDVEVGHGLGAVDDRRRADTVSLGSKRRDIVDGAERIGDVADGDDLGAFAELGGEVVEV